MIINNKPEKNSQDFPIHSHGISFFLRKVILYAIVMLLLAACNSTFAPSNETTTENLSKSTQNEMSGLEKVKEKGIITIGTAITKPFEYYDPQTNELIGLDVDIAQYIAYDLGVNIHWIEIPFASLVPAVEEGKVDIAIAGMYITPERKKVVDFSTPYLKTGLIMAVNPDIHPTIHSVDNIEGLNIGVKIGATGEKLAEEFVNNGMELNITRYQNTLDSLLDLEVGRVDIVFNDYLNTLFYIKEYDSVIQIVEDKNHDTVFLSDATLGIAVNKQNKKLLEEINSILKEMEDNGVINQYYEKWLLSGQAP